MPATSNAVPDSRGVSRSCCASACSSGHADSEIAKIQADAEALRRKTIADAEAYAIRTTSLAQFENLKREAELVQSNPLLIPKTFADRLSDRVQVILTPSIGGEAFTGEIFKRVVNGDVPVSAPATVNASRTSPRPATTH